jgi:hypothetical protein
MLATPTVQINLLCFMQKVIVSSATKTPTPTVRSNTTSVAKDSSRFVKTTTVHVKQDTSQLPSLKVTSSGSGSSKPTVVAGSKSSSVSVAPSKYVAPLPASCLQVVRISYIFNRNNLHFECSLVHTCTIRTPHLVAISPCPVGQFSSGFLLRIEERIEALLVL